MPSATEIRDKRREALLEILGTGTVRRQSDFVEQLNAQGIEATQSSVSRDLRELRIVKRGAGYQRIEQEQAPAGVTGLPAGFVRDIQTAGNNLTVIKTAIGGAQRVAVYLDRSGWPEIVGTVSGDDTIFVATENGRDQKTLLGRLRSSLLT
ncbi:MAG: ArgR family transcriptional regulator [Gammaproteobacteria bacterium]|jgi:transcriptional regulator of arginine metabolism|nr:ArgR family transcriptional regulator [Gammaproteobacteria bacterium]MDP6617621.1 ArgR family transcriptional regulator [Gammaproteobacteria bacterium]MDP6694498.1 ArgR family transcriptional regulator [Gammaproteobacteria bacterium]MDP7041556.1 ArgR family transcriptional regulator [Gammaproteobacteria bacterium]